MSHASLVALLTAGLAIALGAEAVAAREIHVATTGNDSGPGSPDSPYRTIGKAASVAQPGDTAMAFTFCTETGFPAVLKKWRDDPHTGLAEPALVARNRGAFGPAVVAPDD